MKKALRKIARVGRMIAGGIKAGFSTMKMMFIMKAAKAVLGFFENLFGLVAGFFKGAGAWIAGVASGVWSGIMAAGAWLFGAFTTGAAIATLGIGGVVLAFVVGLFVSGAQDTAVQQQGGDEELPDCAEQIVYSDQLTVDPIDEAWWYNANAVYSAFSVYFQDRLGYSKEESDLFISGILGTMQCESGIDPSRIETLYTERYDFHPDRTPQKWAIMQDENSIDEWFWGSTLVWFQDKGMLSDGATSKFGRSVRPSPGDAGGVTAQGYLCREKFFIGGIGIIQWTGSNALDYMEFCEAHEVSWASIEAAIMYLLTEGSGPKGNRYRVDKYVEMGVPANAYEAGRNFAYCVGGLYQERRGVMAEKWLERIQSPTNINTDVCSWDPETQTFRNTTDIEFGAMVVDVNYGETLLDRARVVQSSGLNRMIGKQRNSCTSTLTFDNSSAAAAAVSYAWPKLDQSWKNDGTELYQAVHRAIAPNDPYFMSCDRGVALAVKWSGTDDEFPLGACPDILRHLVSNTEQWMEVEWNYNVANLQPGDVLIYHGHVVMYTGRELIQKIHGSESPGNTMFVSASLDNRSPACIGRNWDYLNADPPPPRRPPEDWVPASDEDVWHSTYYRCFRCIRKESNPRYVHAVDGLNIGVATTTDIGAAGEDIPVRYQGTSMRADSMDGIPAALRAKHNLSGSMHSVDWFDNTGARRNALVYTPPGYDPSQKYNVMVLLHGDNGNGLNWTTDSYAGISAMELYENMLAAGMVEPMIFVSPSYTTVYSGNNRPAADIARAMENSLMPAVISAYSTYATSAADMPAMRDHFAVCGLSGGSIVTHSGFMVECMDTFSYFGCLSCGSLGNSAIVTAWNNNPQRINYLYEASGNYGDDVYYTDYQRSALSAFRSAGMVNEGNSEFHQLQGGHAWTTWIPGFFNFVQKCF